jgi:hypothetical protein
MNKLGPNNRGSEAKPRRERTPPRGRDAVIARRQTPRKALKAQRMHEEARTTGALQMRDLAPSGTATGVIFGVTGPSGGISSNPGDQIAYRVRQAFKPLNIAPAVVTGPDGTILRTITYGPNGERRVSYPAP